MPVDQQGHPHARRSQSRPHDLACAALSALVGLIMVTYALASAGCTPSHVTTVRGEDGLRGRAVAAWITVGHVADEQPIYVRDHWWQGDVLCDAISTNLGPREDPVTLLVPRCDPYGPRGPGDSGSPLVDQSGRVIGLHLGGRSQTCSSLAEGPGSPRSEASSHTGGEEPRAQCRRDAGRAGWRGS